MSRVFTKKSFEQDVLKGKNYKVVFGLIYYDDGDLKSLTEVGRRENTHDDFETIYTFLRSKTPAISNIKTWRYIPQYKVVYWWEDFSSDEKDEVEYHLKVRYKTKGPFIHRRMYTMRQYGHGTIEDRIAQFTGHTPDKIGKDTSKYPTFAQWYKFHQGD